MSNAAFTFSLAGAAGQGVQTGADLLGRILTRHGLWVWSHADVESRIRGGINIMHFVVSDRPCEYVAGAADLVVALTAESAAACAPSLRQEGLAVAPAAWTDPRRLSVDLDALGSQAGSTKVVATAAAALVAAMVGVDSATVRSTVAETFSSRDGGIADANRTAADLALAEASVLPRLAPDLRPESDHGRLFLSGHQALSAGAVAGGVTFFSAYPMSPATGCFIDLAACADEAGIVVVQAEDEVAAINMVAGAGYAGARAMTATSGGGLCLMTEGVSLLGMTETPAVIVVAQRPGPATGMATRTAQEDLTMVIHAGHGFVPRVILAPPDVGSAFRHGALAFDLAERFQVPVFILTDQLLQDGAATLEPPDLSNLPTARHLVPATELGVRDDYVRHADTIDGVSPQAAPGASRHLVVVDSHTHDERGHLTDRPAVAAAWAEKQQRKEASLRQATPPPLVEGDPEGAILVLAWGSAVGTAREAVGRLRLLGHRTALASLEWLWPAPEEELASLMDEAAMTVAVDASVGAVFSRYLTLATGRRPTMTVTRLDGRPFTVEDLTARLAQEVSA